MAQQKQLKQLILTNNKTIITYRFQPVQRLQPEFMTYGTRNFTYTKPNGDCSKRRILSFIPQRQRKQTKYANNQTYKHNPNKQNNDIDVGFTTNKKPMLLQLFFSIHYFTSILKNLQ